MAELKILIVDDEPYIRAGIKRVLRGFKVDYPFMEEPFSFILQEAETGEEAIEMVEADRPDIILLDNKLPGIQGIEVLEFVRKKEYDIVVVMITSYASLDLAVKATKDGAYDFIPKPFTPQEMRSAIENITKQIYLKKMTKEMSEEGKQVRFQFLSVVSHELKAPINAIEGYLQMIKAKQLGADLDNYNQVIDRTLERIKGMRNLILDLLDMTHLESGKKEKKIVDVDFVKVSETALDTINPYAIQREVAINVSAPEKLVAKADLGEIEIIFNNLISNAVKYNKDGGKVDCVLEKLENGVQIMVKDTGIGMTKEESGRLFQEFVRIKNSKTKNITGSGLGLSIVKKLVDTYGGTIKLESEPDVGSQFTVFLPIA